MHDLDRLAALTEPVRRRLYEFVVAQAEPVDRDGAAAGAGVGRPLAAFHLDRLAEAGLLDVTYRRRSGRTGPGAGRPAKFYARARHGELSVSVPPRHYELAATILAFVRANPGHTGEEIRAGVNKGKTRVDDALATLEENKEVIRTNVKSGRTYRNEYSAAPPAPPTPEEEPF